MRYRVSASEQIRPILAAIRSAPLPARASPSAVAAMPFITLSRQPGSGAWSLAEKLAEALNSADTTPAQHPWTAWDGTLVEKVAADHHLSARLVEALVQADRTWLDDFFASLSFYDDPSYADEIKVLHGVIATMRALARTGRVILVGRGSIFVTRHLPGGIHLRLVAPLDWRITHMAEFMQISREQAAEEIRQTTRRRETYWRRYWPGQEMTAELFTATINTAEVSHDAIFEIVLALVRQVNKAGR